MNPEIFPNLNCNHLIDFYHSGEPKLWNGYLLIAIDGSKAEVPNSKGNRETFGNSCNLHSKTGQVRALVSGMCDILNHFYLGIEIEHISVSENELAKRNIKHLREMGIRQPVLAVSSNDYKAERKQMQSADDKVILKHSSARLQEIRKKHPEQRRRGGCGIGTKK